MSDQPLIQYIKKNLADGFSADEIRTALLGAGWDSVSVTDAFADAQTRPAVSGGFLDRHGKKVVVALAVLVALPALGFGGNYLYSKFLNSGSRQIVVDTSDTKAAEADETASNNIEEIVARDQQRLSDIESLQTGLKVYFNSRGVYPKSLAELAVEKIISEIPVDPKLNQPYAYYAFGDPATQYSISFLLEGDIGGLRSGLQVFSSSKILPASLIKSQQALLEGKQTTPASGDLLITDLAKDPFYPGEDVILEVQSPQGVDLQSVKMISGGLSLLDASSPFTFRFSAPSQKGVYEVSVFGFDSAGKGHVGETSITVTEPDNDN